ncbi:MAG TPA: nickel insertion protein [Thermoanaerobaculia bacterium]|nr:nickel insertion protein [Thermoanaerobaculia bacterium]
MVAGDPALSGSIPYPALAPRARLHFDPVGGMAGDMFLGACLDLGVPLSAPEETVAALGLQGVSVEAFTASRGGTAGTRFRVLAEGAPVDGPEPAEEASGMEPAAVVTDACWDLVGVLGLLEASGLPEPVWQRAERLFVRLAEGPARALGVGVAEVRYTGGAGLDFLVDLVGAAAMVERILPMGGRVTCGPLFVGGPAPGERLVPPRVVEEILSRAPGLAEIPRIEEPGAGQCLTPTGATILAELVEGHAGRAAFLVEGEGWGLGRKELPGRVNGVRIVAGRDLE